MLSDIVIILILIIVKGFFAAISNAISVLELKRAKYFSDKENENYDRLVSIMSHSRKDIYAASILDSFLAIIIGFVLALHIYRVTNQYVLLNYTDIINNDIIIKFVSAAVIIIAAAYFLALLSLVVPKMLANKYPDKIALSLGKWLHIAAVILTPFERLIDIAVKLFNVFIKAETEDISEEEILMMVDAGGEQGSIDENEMEMINNIFDFDDKNVVEIATHRKDIVAVPKDISIDELIKVVSTEKFSRIPVYEEDIDNIVGILHVKEFLNHILTDGKENFNIDNIIMEPYFVPATKKTNSLFKEMQTKKFHLAVVADEYGGTAGIVTMEDLIEEVMGEIQDEYDDEEEPEIEEVTENVTRIEGSADLEDVAKTLDIDMPVDEYDTLGGFLIARLDRIPEDGETNILLEYKNCIFRIDKVEDKRIVNVTVTKYQRDEEEE